MDVDTLSSIVRAGFLDHDDDDDANKIIQQYLLAGSIDEANAFDVLPEILNDVYFQCGNRE